METAIVFDCEFLTNCGARQRYWCGPHDPDPVIAQIGAVRLDLNDFELRDSARIFVRPFDRHGRPYLLDPFFTELTGIRQETLDEKGVLLREALTELDRFSRGDLFWSWGKDELNMMAISCYVAGVDVPIQARRFDNACKLLLSAGMPLEDIQMVSSSDLANYYGLESSALRAHDALDDAMSIARALQHLLKSGRLTKDHFQPEGQAGSVVSA
ncbi:MAG: exonuclease domain-containing protein [Alphaproteobacteria bacterium]|nr:exonuclease domain-containing protein [Alphaproteobacteria bacterium]